MPENTCRFHLTIDFDNPISVNALAYLADVEHSEGYMIIDPNPLHSFLQDIECGLDTTTVENGDVHYIVGFVLPNESLRGDWLALANLLDRIALKIRRNLEDYA